MCSEGQHKPYTTDTQRYSPQALQIPSDLHLQFLMTSPHMTPLVCPCSHQGWYLNYRSPQTPTQAPWAYEVNPSMTF